MHPLNNLLRQNTKWVWSAECTKSLLKVKENLISAKVLTHYDPKLDIVLATDVSAYGVGAGAVLFHIQKDGSEKLVAFASRTLLSAECNYSQIEKEALSIVFGVNKHYQYLYGRNFKLLTDHQPYVTIFGPKRGVPTLAAA